MLTEIRPKLTRYSSRIFTFLDWHCYVYSFSNWRLLVSSLKTLKNYDRSCVVLFKTFAVFYYFWQATVNLPQIRIEFGFIGCNWSCFMKVFDLFLNDFVRCVHWRMRLHFMRRTNLSTSTCITNLYRVVEDTAQKEPCSNSQHT